MWTRFIELAGEISTQIPRYVVSRLVEALNGEGVAGGAGRVVKVLEADWLLRHKG